MRKVKILPLIIAAFAVLTQLGADAQTREPPMQRPSMVGDGAPTMEQGSVGQRRMMGMTFGAVHQATPEQVEGMVSQWMGKLKASPEQTKHVIRLALDVQRELQPLREKMRTVHEKRNNALFGQAVDRNALESAGKEGLQLHDQMSARMSRFMADAAQVLTPEQRAQAGKMMQERQAHMEIWRDKQAGQEGEIPPAAIPPSRK